MTETIHLKYGGSTATRTLNCPAWVNVAEKAPKIDRTSAAAERGTRLHQVMEDIYNDVAIDPTLYSDDDMEAINTAWEITEKLLNKYQIEELLCEQMVQLPGYEIGGSADMIAFGPEVVLIVDYKFGYQPVTETDQFKLYAIAGRQTPEVALEFIDRRIISAIVQPAVDVSNAIEHEHTPEELDQFRQKFLQAVKTAETGTTDGNPGPWCKYCPGAAYCDAKRNQVVHFLDINPKVSRDLARGMEMVAEMKEQIKAIEGEVFFALEHGIKVPGWKLVLKEARRHWKDTAEALRKLRNARKIKKDMYLDEVLKSPAQVEKSLKKAGVDFQGIFDELVEKKSTGTTIAPESDKRPAVETGVVPAPLDAIPGR